jgi:iron complex transport system ATP-binding protein
MSLLEARGLAIGYGAKVLARDIDLQLEAGTVTCLLGPNGVGKTTLFKTLLGLTPALAGSLRIGAEDLTRLSRRALAKLAAYVPQAQPQAFAYTVEDLVLMGRTSHLGPFSAPGRADREAAHRALASMGVAHLADSDVTHISGGQQQLALIARALAQDARIIVMDEPTASLDLGNRMLVLEKIRALAGQGLAILIATHDPEQAFDFADRVAVLTPQRAFLSGNVDAILTQDLLASLYGIDLVVEITPNGRRVVSPALPARNLNIP